MHAAADRIEYHGMAAAAVQETKLLSTPRYTYVYYGYYSLRVIN